MFDLLLILFLFVPHEIPQHSHFIVVVFIEIEPVLMSEPDLEEVVVQTLLGDVHFLRCLVKRDFWLLGACGGGAFVEVSPFDDLDDKLI